MNVEPNILQQILVYCPMYVHLYETNTTHENTFFYFIRVSLLPKSWEFNAMLHKLLIRGFV